MTDLTRQRCVAYMRARDKTTKDKFRLCMHEFPSRYDYAMAKVPGPISECQLNDKTEKEKVGYI